MRFYSLDVIISVGYRVKSLAGTRFRQWATRTLREHLVRGYTLNRQRFEHNAQELEAALVLVRRAATGELLTTDQGRGLIDIIARYTQTFLLLQRYDEGLLVAPKGVTGGILPGLDEANAAIGQLKQDLIARNEPIFSGREREDGLAGLLGNLSKASLVNQLIRPSNPKPPISSTLSSRITPLPTATSVSARSSWWIFFIATDGCSATTSR